VERGTWAHQIERIRIISRKHQQPAGDPKPPSGESYGTSR